MKYSFNFKTYQEYEEVLSALIVEVFNSDIKRSDVVSVSIGRNKVDMYISSYMFNLILARIPVFYDNKKIILYEDTNVTSRKLNDYINKNIIDKYIYEVDDVFVLKKLIIKIIEDLVYVSAKTNTYSGNTINIYDVVKEASKNKKLYDLMQTKLDGNLSVMDGEKKLNELTEQFKDFLSEFDSSLNVYLDSGVGIRDKQLRETFINMGYVSGITGQIIPKSINNSLLNGMDGPIEYYISAIGARKALVTNHNLVGRSGSFTRKSLLLLTDMDFAPEYDCGSEVYTQVEVTNTRRLLSLHGKWYLTKSGSLKLIDKTNEKLIGRVLSIRSPITCKHSHENMVCKKCFGEMWRSSEDLHIGIMSVLYLTSNFTQALLSTKHLSKITVESVMWDDATKKYFNIERSSLTLKNYNIEINIDASDIEDYETRQGKINSMTIVDGDVETFIKFPMPIYNDDIIKIIEDSGKVTISGNNLKKLKFKYIIENSEFFKILAKTLALLDNNTIKEKESYQEVLHEFTNILDESKVTLYSSFSELFISNLIRNADNPHMKHNFHDGSKYSLVRMSTAIQYSSQIMGISFERIKTQFQDVNFYNNNNTSAIENFYR